MNESQKEVVASFAQKTRGDIEGTHLRAEIMEKRHVRRSKARRGSERRHWSRYFYDSNARKTESTQIS